jgi:hypothetical protein
MTSSWGSQRPAGFSGRIGCRRTGCRSTCGDTLEAGEAASELRTRALAEGARQAFDAATAKRTEIATNAAAGLGRTRGLMDKLADRGTGPFRAIAPGSPDRAAPAVGRRLWGGVRACMMTALC